MNRYRGRMISTCICNIIKQKRYFSNRFLNSRLSINNNKSKIHINHSQIHHKNPISNYHSNFISRNNNYINISKRLTSQSGAISIDPMANHLKKDSNFKQSDPSTNEAPKPTLHDKAAPIDYGTIYRERTPVTSSLWRLRENLVKDDQPNIEGEEPVRAPLIERSPSDSIIEINYNFKDNSSIRNEYTRFDGGVRFEKILEDMDALAGNVAQTHSDNNDNYPIAFVTASVDRIDMQRRWPMNRNLVMQGRIVYVGTSSSNILISIYDRDNLEYEICGAHFIMVARDDYLKSKTFNKSIKINPLKLENDLDNKLYLRGKFDGEIRKTYRKERLNVKSPTSEESNLIHQFWLDLHVNRELDYRDKTQYRFINKTRVEATTICQPQEMNRNGKIFGGYLMRGAYELARSCAYRFSGGAQRLDAESFNIDKHAVFVSSDEISFELPVTVGSIITHEAMIACTDSLDYEKYREYRKLNGIERDDRHCMAIIVRTRIQEPGEEFAVLSNLFSFTFVIPAKNLRQVIPYSYEESMIYIFGKRALVQSRAIALRDGGLLAQYA